MFNDYVILHTPTPSSATQAAQPNQQQSNTDKNISSTEKMTQTSVTELNGVGAGNGSNLSTVWQVNLPPQHLNGHQAALSNAFADCSDLALNEAMTCQELLAFSVAFSAALPTSQTTLETFYTSLSKPDALIAACKPSSAAVAVVAANEKQFNSTLSPVNGSAGAAVTASGIATTTTNGTYGEYACCAELYKSTGFDSAAEHRKKPRSKCVRLLIDNLRLIGKVFGHIRRCVRLLVEQKYFQQGILLAILINTLSMGIEYHNQPEELTAIVETSNIVFSGIFAVEMLLKVIAEGPFKYIANGFNVFDGVIVILR